MARTGKGDWSYGTFSDGTLGLTTNATHAIRVSSGLNDDVWPFDLDATRQPRAEHRSRDRNERQTRAPTCTAISRPFCLRIAPNDLERHARPIRRRARQSREVLVHDRRGALNQRTSRIRVAIVRHHR